MSHEKHEKARKRGQPPGWRCLVAGLALVVGPALQAAETASTPPGVGHWDGSAQVAVTWCAQRELPVSLHIRPDGSVTGRVGDAELTKGRIAPKWRWFQRDDPRRATHLVRGNLLGPLVAAEGIKRRGVFVHVRFNGDQASGSLTTSGTKVGGKDSMFLMATPLALTRK